MRTRITILATAVVLVALLLGSFALLGLFRRALLHAQSGEVRARAQAVAALTVDGTLPNPLPSLDTPRLTLIQVLDAHGTVIAASSQLAGTPALRDPGPQRRKVLDDIGGVRGGPWLTEVAVVPIGGQDRTVVVITSLSGYARGADLLRTSLLVIVPILLLIVAVTVWLVVGRALRPVEAMCTEAESITGRQLDRRVPIPPTGDEIARLAMTLNDMLDRLQASSDGQRRFVADASHELRTPIANIRMAVEVAAAHPDRADWPTVAADVLLQDQRMQQLTDDLLTLARADAGSPALRVGSVDLSALLREELARPLPPGRLLIAEGTLPAVLLPGDGEQLRRMVTNLVDNALRHAEHTVTIGLRAVPVSGHAMVEIRVSDDGPGVPMADRDNVFDPFVRLDQHRARGPGGTGLGLSIVRRVAQAHHGSVTVTDTDNGTGTGTGATFVVLLPAVASSR